MTTNGECVDMGGGPITRTRSVRHVDGTVLVENIVIASRFRGGYKYERLMAQLRERTPDAWWEWAFDCHEAEYVTGTGGPLGPGVDFFCDDRWLAVDPEVREAIQDDAYEAAREAILDGLDRHFRRLDAALPWAAPSVRRRFDSA